MDIHAKTLGAVLYLAGGHRGRRFEPRSVRHGGHRPERPDKNEKMKTLILVGLLCLFSLATGYSQQHGGAYVNPVSIIAISPDALRTAVEAAKVGNSSDLALLVVARIIVLRQTSVIAVIYARHSDYSEVIVPEIDPSRYAYVRNEDLTPICAH
jgi:hypothetical protein